jgi:hypothetical protein
MYTLEQLEQKNIKQLKEIGHQLNVLPEADRRCRQNWIDALVGVNPPLLQLLEVSPAVEEVEQAAKAIAPAVKTKKRAQKSVEEVQALASFKIGDLVKSLTKRRGIKNKSLTGTVVFVHPSGGVRVTFFGGGTLDYSRSQLKDLIVQEPPITKVVNILKLKSPEILDGIAWHFFYQSPEWLQKVLWPRIWDESEDIDFVEMIIRSFCGNRLLGCNFDNIFEIFQRVLAGQEEIQARELARNEKRQARKLEVEAQDPIQVQRQESIVPAAKNFPGVETEVTVSESAIAPAAKISLAAESDRNPILTGIPLSDKFLARYSPPQPENIRFQSEADGQLSLLNFEVVTESEPPDPDDFETLDAFREAIVRWDREHPEELAVSLDSFCEWAPCPDTWYESAEVVEVAPSVVIESSITCNFFIPTFDAWCDRFNRSDEPPDTGIYATLPKPKPPSFPPTAVSQARVKRGLNAYQTHTKRIPKVSRTHTHCIVVGSSTQPARSPPGGDVCLV